MYMPRTHYYKPSDIHLHTSKQEKWNKLTCWLCGKTGHTSNRCPIGEESKKNRGKKNQPPNIHDKAVKIETQTQCRNCGSKNHDTNHCPNISIIEHLQQQQLEKSSIDSFSSSS